jgi:hypothetical protein
VTARSPSDQGLEFVGINTQSDYVHFAPIGGVAVLHKLAAPEVADIEEQRRRFNLAREIASFYL